MDDLTKRALLFDFYGSLLTKKQRDIYDLYRQQDLSLGEISELQGVSRTAVYDLNKRTDEVLNHYEARLGLVQKYVTAHTAMQELRQLLGELQKTDYAQGWDHWDKLNNLLNKLEDSW